MILPITIFFNCGKMSTKRSNRSGCRIREESCHAFSWCGTVFHANGPDQRIREESCYALF